MSHHSDPGEISIPNGRGVYDFVLRYHERSIGQCFSSTFDLCITLRVFWSVKVRYLPTQYALAFLI